MSALRKATFLLAAFLAFLIFPLRGAEVIPPPPKAWFNDDAGVVRPEVAARLNRELEQFERDTSNQIVVVVEPKMRSDSSIEDYTVRVAQAWRVGQKGRDNGAILFVFIQNRKMYIQVGYGLEGALPDYLAHTIIEREIKPRFQAGDYTGGLEAGVRAMTAAAKGEYKGTGRIATEGTESEESDWLSLLILLGILFLFTWISIRRGRSGGTGPREYTSDGPTYYGGGWGGGGGWSGGGGFGGGGGSFGGGGAGGRW